MVRKDKECLCNSSVISSLDESICILIIGCIGCHIWMYKADYVNLFNLYVVMGDSSVLIVL